MLFAFLITKSQEKQMEIKKSAMTLYKTALKTEINKRLGFHQIGEGIEEYLKNQSAGKIIFKPSLTPVG